ncbi:hypothetical protein ALX04_006630 [Lactiplantibacillus plantarum subsp. plantarum]|uniref:hypothetical protein n=1 Tax=Lactiplantibacillus plantarum TaxID=1590 RepID=UPI0006A6A578|nr:hypothetical protein [Lactiplantibacillus plantarum]ASI63357.1 hypothetical protein ALX04_006630 [Lactiplantibacillus plantarum subsp. plantarum]AUV71634.1 hypothetical protein C1940_03755 [Lactiplantibacillus plantarum subsp. plantarum]KAE9508234.1 hypothetical protein FET70_01695 [Lactiplantibacillus plantarum]MCG0628396.1 hypothetical protein [Lactiplantibacillus plantarum]MCG0694532.1 hypothetical protein [Lactiplantibacillus plantarum]
MSEIDILKRNIQNISKTKDSEYKRSLLYSGYTTLLLSTHFFKLNINLKEFLTPLLSELEKVYPLHRNQTLIFKDYVYKSRSVVISRMLRVIQKADSASLSKLEFHYSSFISENTTTDNNTVSKDTSKKTNKRNSVDDLFQRFDRG